MPVNETAALARDLTSVIGASVDRVYMNGLYPERFDGADEERIEAAAAAGDGQVRDACLAALSERRRAAAQRIQLARLEELAAAPVRRLPFLFEPELGLEQIRGLAEAVA
jgi:hypothetical protein